MANPAFYAAGQSDEALHMCPEPDDRTEELRHARRLAERFATGDLAFARFNDGLTSILGTAFDGLDSQLQGLPGDVQREVRLYSEWTDGEWGETRATTPKRSDWVYGEDSEPYGWIDQVTYHREFAAAFAQLSLDAQNAEDA